jgi:hypothetical protein
VPEPQDDLQPLVERIYDIVVAPDRLEQLLDSWNERLEHFPTKWLPGSSEKMRQTKSL